MKLKEIFKYKKYKQIREREREKRAKLEGGIEFLNRYIELTTPTNNRQIQQEILKKNLQLIEIEISSFCNRKCWFCPNAFIDRKSSEQIFSEDIFLKCMENLAQIDYCNGLNFHRFNETLANKPLALKRIAQARSYLPKANLGVFTNGDYLDRQYLDEIKKAGASFILMSYYAKKDEPYDIERNIKPAIEKMSAKLGLNYKEIRNDIYEYGVEFIYDGMWIYYRCWNPAQSGSDRGGAIDEIANRSKIRTRGCAYPLVDIYLDYNHLAMPCCNLRSDIESHKNYILGDASKEDLFSLFMNENFIKMRQILSGDSAKSGACKYCSYYRGLDSWLN